MATAELEPKGISHIPMLRPPALRVAQSIHTFLEYEKSSLLIDLDPNSKIEISQIDREAQQMEGELLVTGNFEQKKQDAETLATRLLSTLNKIPRITSNKDYRNLVYYGVERLVNYLKNPQPIVINIKDTLLTQKNIDDLIEGMSGFAGSTLVESSSETIKLHLAEDYQLVEDLGTTFWEVGNLLSDVVRSGHVPRGSKNPEVEAVIQGHKYKILNKHFLTPSGLSFEYFDDELDGYWDRYNTGDFLVTDENGESIYFGGNCQKACKYKGYIEPKTVDAADQYRVDPGEVLEFFHAIPTGKTLDQIREIRLTNYQKDLQNDDGRVREYAALKLIKMKDERGIDLIIANMQKPKVETRYDLLALLRTMRSFSEIKNPKMKEKGKAFLIGLDFSQIKDPSEKADFEERRTQYIQELEKS